AIQATVAEARSTANAVHRDRRHHACERRKRCLNVIPNAARQGEIRPKPPRILRKDATHAITALERRWPEFLVLAGNAVEDRLTGDAGYPSGQHGIRSA